MLPRPSNTAPNVLADYGPNLVGINLSLAEIRPSLVEVGHQGSPFGEHASKQRSVLRRKSRRAPTNLSILVPRGPEPGTQGPNLSEKKRSHPSHALNASRIKVAEAGSGPIHAATKPTTGTNVGTGGTTDTPDCPPLRRRSVQLTTKARPSNAKPWPPQYPTGARRGRASHALSGRCAAKAAGRGPSHSSPRSRRSWTARQKTQLSNAFTCCRVAAHGAHNPDPDLAGFPYPKSDHRERRTQSIHPLRKDPERLYTF